MKVSVRARAWCLTRLSHVRRVLAERLLLARKSAQLVQHRLRHIVAAERSRAVRRPPASHHYLIIARSPALTANVTISCLT